jgi:hypothetical protein
MSLFRSPDPVEALFGFQKRGIATEAYRGKQEEKYLRTRVIVLTERPVLYPWRSPKFEGPSDALCFSRFASALEGPQNAISHRIVVL